LIAEQAIAPGVFYASHPDHRTAGLFHKSQWTISVPDETSCFDRTFKSKWINPPQWGWGLYMCGASVAYLGVSAKAAGSEQKLFIAKFVDGNADMHWHGYPADPRRGPQDVPPPPILSLWTGQYLRKPLIRKISRGQQCSL
jgi:hypothetical protein